MVILAACTLPAACGLGDLEFGEVAGVDGLETEKGGVHKIVKLNWLIGVRLEEGLGHRNFPSWANF